MGKKVRELEERICVLERDLRNIRCATENIIKLMGAKIEYYSYSTPLIITKNGCVLQRIQAICDFLDIKLVRPKVEEIKKEPELVAIKIEGGK